MCQFIESKEITAVMDIFFKFILTEVHNGSFTKNSQQQSPPILSTILGGKQPQPLSLKLLDILNSIRKDSNLVFS